MNLINLRLFQLPRLTFLVALMSVALAIGCESDNSDSGGNGSGGGAPDSVSGTWAGDGISVTLSEESRQPDGLGGFRSEGSATLTNPRGTFGSGLYSYSAGGLYAVGDGFQVSGTVEGNTWSATYLFPDDRINTYVTLQRQ